MQTLMLVEIKLACESPVATRKRACIGLVASTDEEREKKKATVSYEHTNSCNEYNDHDVRVRAFVTQQIGTTGKAFATLVVFATVGLFTRVNSAMHFHVGFAQETLVAKFAGKVLVTLMDIAMSLEISFELEFPTTAWKRASKDFFLVTVTSIAVFRLQSLLWHERVVDSRLQRRVVHNILCDHLHCQLIGIATFVSFFNAPIAKWRSRTSR